MQAFVFVSLALLFQTTALSPTDNLLSKECARRAIGDFIFPTADRDERYNLGRKAQGLDQSEALTNNDERLFLTYAEFPLQSLDEALDTVVGSGARVVDLGSGCGRLAIYMALTRDYKRVYGLEISKLLHDEANKATERAEGDYKQLLDGRLSFQLGAALDCKHVLKEADLVFCYSTAFEGAEFSTKTSSLLLSRSWRDLLWETCKPGCTIITTDKSLDKRFHLVKSFSVPNPEVLESTVYVHVVPK